MSLYDQANNLDLNEPYNVSKGFQPRIEDLFKSQQGQTNDYFSRFTGQIKAQEPVQHIYERIGRQEGLPQARQNMIQANQHQGAIPGLYEAGTRGFDVNANQKDRIIGTAQAAYAPVVSSANAAYQGANEAVNAQAGYTQAQQEKELQPIKSEADFIKDFQARQQTGYTFAMQSELQAVLDKLAKGVTLTEGERTRANQLAIAKLSYDAQMAQIASNEKMQTQRINANPFGL